MTNTTKYEIRANDAVVAIRSKKDAAIKLAHGEHQVAQGKSTVTVVTNAGTEVFRMEAVVAKAGRAKPFGRTEVPNFPFEPLEGHTVAYVRNRIKTVVFRADDRSGYVVVNTVTGRQYKVENTSAARRITNGLQFTHRADRARAIAQAKADKAAAKAAKAALKATAEVLAAAPVEPAKELQDA
jgi:hypothetical protein